MTDKELLKWASTATAGARTTYHVGFLAVDCGGGRSELTVAELAKGATRALAAKLEEHGLVTLTQRRHGPGDYDYLIQRTAKSIRAVSEADLTATQQGTQ